MSVICYYNKKYNLYSTVSDGFFFNKGISLKELQAYIVMELGRKGLSNLDARLEHAHVKGTSSLLDDSLEEFLCCNRAGEDEKHLSVEECIEKFLS